MSWVGQPIAGAGRPIDGSSLALQPAGLAVDGRREHPLAPLATGAGKHATRPSSTRTHGSVRQLGRQIFAFDRTSLTRAVSLEQGPSAVPSACCLHPHPAYPSCTFINLCRYTPVTTTSTRASSTESSFSSSSAGWTTSPSLFATAWEFRRGAPNAVRV